jgi:Na+-translocating ferredoxin:NAD+ oxidoreductase subunit A
MNIPVIFQIAIGAVLINNFVLERMLGLCPVFCFSKNLSNAAGMGVTVTFVMGLSTACSWLFDNLILIPYEMTYLRLIVFIVIIATLVQLMELTLQKFSPKLNESLGMNLPLITTDCAILGAVLINTQNNPLTGLPFTFPEACVNGIASGIGFLIVIILMAGIREKLELAHGRKSFQGLPIALIVAGLMSMVFLGFMGIKFCCPPGGY